MPSDPDSKGSSSIRDVVLEQEEAASIIRNRSLLDPNEIVDEERIVGRDEQLTEISRHLRVALNGDRPPNLLLYGPSGTGKSLISNAVSQTIIELCESRNIRLGVISLNCQNISTLGSAVYALCRKVANDAGVAVEVAEQGVPTDKKWRELYRLVNENYDSVVFILDELDMLVGRRDFEEPAFSRLLYQLSRATSSEEVKTNISVTAITNDTKMMENVGSRAASSFSPTEIHFNDYDANQLREILRHREDAFYDNSLTEDVIPLIAAFAAQTHGDARKAVDLMRMSGIIAEREVAEKVREEHVRAAQEKLEKNRVLEVIRGISTQKKLSLFATAAVARETDDGTATSPDGYAVYEFLTEMLDAEQYHQETFVNKMKELTTYSLVETERKSQGPHSGSYLEFTLGEDPGTIVETLKEDSRFAEVSDQEIRSVAKSQLA